MNQSAVSLAQGAIALLIDLARRGEIDPWDVRVIEAIDRCLSELTAAEGGGFGFYEVNLSQSGQAFLDASLLVLLKANTLESLEEPETNADSQLEAAEDLEDSTDPRLPLHLERQLRRRRGAQPPTHRRVTLQELIEQLRLVAAAVEKESRAKRPSSRSSASQSRAAMRTALELAGQENLSEMARELEHFLIEYWPCLSEGREWLELEQLLALWSEAMATKTEELPSNSVTRATPEKKPDRADIFWALLLLSAQSKVELVQAEFYQDLRIRTCQP